MTYRFGSGKFSRASLLALLNLAEAGPAVIHPETENFLRRLELVRTADGRVVALTELGRSLAEIVGSI